MTPIVQTLQQISKVAGPHENKVIFSSLSLLNCQIAHIVSVSWSLMKMRLPAITGCALVTVSATL